MLAVAPTCHWLEFMDFGSGILANPYQINDGQVTAQGPGLSIHCNESAVDRTRTGNNLTKSKKTTKAVTKTAFKTI